MRSFSKVVVVAISIFFILSSALASDEIVIKDGKSYLKMDNGKLILIQRAVAVEEPIAPKAIEVRVAVPVTEDATPPIITQTETPVVTPDNNPLLESSIAKDVPLEDFDFSEIESSAEYEDSDGVLGAGALVVAIGIYAVRRITYLNQHPGLKASNELQREINKLDGLARRTTALQTKLGIQQKIVGNKIVLFLKPGFSLKGQISKLKTELRGLELEWTKQDAAFSRLEEKIDAEHLRRRQEVFLALDKEQHELRERKRTALASSPKNFISDEVAKEAELSDARLEESNNKLKHLKNEIATLDSTHKALLDRIQGSGDPGRFATHPLALANQVLLQELKDTAEKYRILKFQAFSQTASAQRDEEIKRTEEKLQKLRPQATEAIEKSYAKQSEEKALDLRIVTKELETAVKKNKIAQAQLQAEIAEFSEIKAKSLAVLDQQITDSEDTIDFFRSLSVQNGGDIVDNIPLRVNKRLNYEDPETIHKPNEHFSDLDLARARLEVAQHTSAEDKFNKEAEILDEINNRFLSISLNNLEKKKKNLSKSEGGDFWITKLREEALRRVSNKYKVFNSHAFDTNDSFLKLIAGDNQSVSAEDAEIARRLIRETYADLDNQFNEGKKLINPWYLKADKNQDMQIHLYHIVRKLRPISLEGSKIEQARELSQSKRAIAAEYYKMRYIAAADVSGHVVDSARNRSMAEAATEKATHRSTSSGSTLSGCLTKLRRQVAIF